MNNKRVTLLKDSETGSVEAIIISEKTTPVEIQECIDRARASEMYDLDAILSALPADCVVCNGWGDIGTVTY